MLNRGAACLPDRGPDGAEDLEGVVEYEEVDAEVLATVVECTVDSMEN
jgi:hypothetical protein